MEVKTIEIRDRATFIPALAIKLDPVTEGDRYLLARAGYGITEEDQGEYVILMNLSGGEGNYSCDPNTWGIARTMPVIHKYLIDAWEEVESGQVLDAEFIMGESKYPKESEQREEHLGWDSIG